MRRPFVSAKNFKNFAELASVYTEGRDYALTLLPRVQSGIGIVAPHGGRIESHTSEIATAIAGEDFSVYLFEGILCAQNFEALHLTSHTFDEPYCLDLLAHCDDVVTVHGCNAVGEVVLVGGLDDALAKELAHAMTQAGLECHVAGHAFPGKHPSNICNRGRRGMGVQLELSTALRRSPLRKQQLVVAVREVLMRRHVNRQSLASPGRSAKGACADT